MMTMFKTRLWGRALRVLVSLQLLIVPAQFGLRVLAFAAQARPGLTAEEAKRARAVAAEFSERLLRARDLAPVVREMFVADFARRYVAEQGKRHGGGGDFMFDGIPALQFRRELAAAHAESELWPRFYVAANDLLHYGFLTFMAKGGPKPNALEQELRRVYPAEVFELFARRPTLANFFVKRGDYVAVDTLEELRETTETLERAARLTREQLDRNVPLKPEKLDANMGELRRMADRLPVEPLDTGGESFLGYPAGTRLLKVVTPVGLMLILAPDGDKLKVVWASTPTG